MAQVAKNLPTTQEIWVRSLHLTPGSGRSPGKGNDIPLQYSCLESFIHEEHLIWNPIDSVSPNASKQQNLFIADSDTVMLSFSF